MRGKFGSKFKYNKELEELKNSNKFQIEEHMRISNTEFEQIIIPFVNWTQQLQILNKLHFKTYIYRDRISKNRELIIEIEPINISETGLAKQTLMLPDNLRNISLARTYIAAEWMNLVVKNEKTIIVNNNTYGTLLLLILNGQITMLPYMMIQLEKIGLTRLNKFYKLFSKRTENERAVKDFYESYYRIRLMDLINLVDMHLIALGNSEGLGAMNIRTISATLKYIESELRDMTVTGLYYVRINHKDDIFKILNMLAYVTKELANTYRPQ